MAGSYFTQPFKLKMTKKKFELEIQVFSFLVNFFGSGLVWPAWFIVYLALWFTVWFDRCGSWFGLAAVWFTVWLMVLLGRGMDLGSL